MCYRWQHSQRLHRHTPREFCPLIGAHNFGWLSVHSPFNDLAACAAEALRLIKLVAESHQLDGAQEKLSDSSVQSAVVNLRCSGANTLFNGKHNKWPIGDAHACYNSAVHSSNAIRTHDSAIRRDHRASKVSRDILLASDKHPEEITIWISIHIDSVLD